MTDKPKRCQEGAGIKATAKEWQSYLRALAPVALAEGVCSAKRLPPGPRQGRAHGRRRNKVENNYVRENQY